MDKGKVRVLVYGTLKKDQVNHTLLKELRAEFLGYDSVTSNHELLDLGPFPAAVRASEPREIRGEVWVLDEEGLAHLDLLEGHPNFFYRTKMWTDQLRKRVWMYYCGADDITRGAVSMGDGMWYPSKQETVFWA